jgi:P pilus assembly chaperone PapD
MRALIRSCLLAALLAGSAASVSAFTFQPMFVRLDASGQGSVQTFQVSNESDESLAVRLSVLSRSVGPDGTETNEDAGSLFTMYPARLTIDPHSSAAVKLQWTGPANLTVERPFRFMAENVAVDSAESPTSGIKVMFRYIASVYVGNADFSPYLTWVVKGAKGANGAKGFMVEIVNGGTRHVIAESAVLSIAGVKGKVVALKAKELKALSGANYLPGSPQRLFIPQADAVVGTIYAAKLAYDPRF